MSQMSGIESSVATPAPGKDNDNENKIFVGLIVVAIILLLAIIFTSTSSTGASKGDGGDDGSDGSNDGDSFNSNQGSSGGKFEGGKPPPPTTTTKKYVRRTTREVITFSPTPDQFLTDPTPKLWSPLPAAGSQSDTLLCVVGQNENSAVNKPKFPEDGVCDLTFYAHLVYRDNEFQGTENKVSWTTFQNVASRSQKTGYGFSVDYKSTSTFHSTVFGTNNKQSTIKSYFDNKKIKHYGVLNALDTESALKQSASSSTGLGILRSFKALQRTWSAPNNHLVVGVRFPSFFSNSYIGKSSALKDIVNKTAATIVVIHSHVTTWRSNERPLCMTSWMYIRNRTTEPNLKEIASNVIPNAAIPETVIVMISFTMSAQIFKTDSVYRSSKANFQAKAFGWLPYAQMCLGVMKYDDLDANADVYISSLDKTFSFCAERTETLISKFQKWMVNRPPKKHGIALFDVELDDVDDVCKRGPFNRIVQLRRYLRS